MKNMVQLDKWGLLVTFCTSKYGVIMKSKVISIKVNDFPMYKLIIYKYVSYSVCKQIQYFAITFVYNLLFHNCDSHLML